MSPNNKILSLFFLVIILLILILILESRAQVNPLNVYLANDSSSISDTIAYPKAGMGIGSTYGSEDWTYNSPALDLYIDLNGSQSLYAAQMNINWDTNFVSIISRVGNLFDSYFFDTISSKKGNLTINIASLNGNVMPSTGKYLVDLKIKLLKPGFSRVILTNPDFRYFDTANYTQLQIPVTVYNGAVKFYLGDFARSQSVIYLGDGKVNFKDASVFFQHYGSFEGDGIYRTKFDIASPGNLDYTSMPVPDGQIDFWDLVMFATGYSKQGSGQLQLKDNYEQVLNKNNHINYYLGNIIKEGENIKIPVYISGDINSLHGISVGVEYNPKLYELIEISNGELSNYPDVLSTHRLQGSTIYLDAVTISNLNFNKNQIITGYILLRKKISINKTEINIISCDAVGYNNTLLKPELLQKVK